MNQTNFWNDAAKYGAVIGGASAVCSLLGDATGAGFFGLIGLALYIGLLLYYTRKRATSRSTREEEYGYGRRLGFIVAMALFVGVIYDLGQPHPLHGQICRTLRTIVRASLENGVVYRRNDLPNGPDGAVASLDHLLVGRRTSPARPAVRTGARRPRTAPATIRQQYGGVTGWRSDWTSRWSCRSTTRRSRSPN